jgi:hypothetical protein
MCVYDGMQIRISKVVRTLTDTTFTFYVRDAQGNVMGIFTRTTAATPTIKLLRGVSSTYVVRAANSLVLQIKTALACPASMKPSLSNVQQEKNLPKANKNTTPLSPKMA